jgi:Zn-dependent peptidase ImmA (M78 family)
MTKVQDLVARTRMKPKELSARSGIPPDRINALLAGAEPSMAEVRRVAEALRVPLMDLAAPKPVERQVELLFRSSLQARNRSHEPMIAAFSKRMSDSLDLLRSGQPGPWWAERFLAGDNTYAGAEQNATTFRKLFYNDDQMSPIPTLPRIAAERMGVLLSVVDMAGIDGASAYFEGRPFIFVSKRFPPRMLLTLAHELGHLVAHHDPSQSFAVVDAETEEAGLSSRGATDEAYAQAFASALLMPRAGVGIALKKVRELAKSRSNELGDIELLYLARIFAVSFVAAARRCEDLTLLPTGGAVSLNEALIKEFGSAEKRGQQLKLPPRPRIDFPTVPAPLLSSAVEKIRTGELSIGRASAVLKISIADLLAANAPTAH